MISRLSLVFVVAATALASFAACAAHSDPNPNAGAGRKIEITVTEQGFEPDAIAVKRGEAIRLGFTRKTDHTCARSVELHLSDKDKIVRDLPLGKRVEIPITFPTAGELRYSCSMDMVTGVIRVE